MTRLTMTAIAVLALAANTAQAAERKCFELADDDPRLIADCPPIKLAQGENRGMMLGGENVLGRDGPRNRNNNQNQNQNNNQNQNQNNNQGNN